MIIITLLTENDDGEPPSTEELQAWANEYDETFPVVSDGERYIHSFGAKGKGEVSLPSHTLLGPGGVIIFADGEFTEEDIIGALP